MSFLGGPLGVTLGPRSLPQTWRCGPGVPVSQEEGGKGKTQCMGWLSEGGPSLWQPPKVKAEGEEWEAAVQGPRVPLLEPQRLADGTGPSASPQLTLPLSKVFTHQGMS